MSFWDRWNGWIAPAFVFGTIGALLVLAYLLNRM